MGWAPTTRHSAILLQQMQLHAHPCTDWQAMKELLGEGCLLSLKLLEAEIQD